MHRRKWVGFWTWGKTFESNGWKSARLEVRQTLSMGSLLLGSFAGICISAKRVGLRFMNKVAQWWIANSWVMHAHSSFITSNGNGLIRSFSQASCTTFRFVLCGSGNGALELKQLSPKQAHSHKAFIDLLRQIQDLVGKGFRLRSITRVSSEYLEWSSTITGTTSNISSVPTNLLFFSWLHIATSSWWSALYYKTRCHFDTRCFMEIEHEAVDILQQTVTFHTYAWHESGRVLGRACHVASKCLPNHWIAFSCQKKSFYKHIWHLKKF